MSWLSWRIVLPVVLVGLVVLGVLVTPTAPLLLVFGWVLFLARVLPRMTADWPSVAVGISAFLLFTLGVHLAGRAWSGGGWRLRWSLAGTLLAVVLFASGTALVAAIHQVAWLVTSPEPLLVEGIPGGPGHRLNELRGVGFSLSDYTGTTEDRRLPPAGRSQPMGRCCTAGRPNY